MLFWVVLSSFVSLSIVGAVYYITLDVLWAFLIFMWRYYRMSSLFFFLMIRRPPRSTLDRSSAASDVYKRQVFAVNKINSTGNKTEFNSINDLLALRNSFPLGSFQNHQKEFVDCDPDSVSYTHLRAHETVLDLVCRLLLEKKTNRNANVLNGLMY